MWGISFLPNLATKCLSQDVFACQVFVLCFHSHLKWVRFLEGWVWRAVLLWESSPAVSVSFCKFHKGLPSGFGTVQFTSVAQLCLTLCDPMDCSTAGLLVHYQLPERTQTHLHWVDDAIQLSHPLSFPSPALSLSQYQGLFQWVLRSGSQSIGVSASSFSLHSVLPMNIRDWFPWGWTGWISLQSKGLSRVFSNITFQKHQLFDTQLSLHSNSHTHTWILEKTIALTRWIFVGNVTSLLLIKWSRLVITFLPRSKHLLISWLQSPSAIILEPRKIVSYGFHCFPIYLPWSDGTGCHDLSLLNVVPQANFSLSSFTFI